MKFIFTLVFAFVTTRDFVSSLVFIARRYGSAFGICSVVKSTQEFNTYVNSKRLQKIKTDIDNNTMIMTNTAIKW